MKFLFATLVFLASTLANAVVEIAPDWGSIQVETIVEQQNVLVTARVRNDRLAALKVKLAETTIDVPAAELADLPHLNLQSLRIVSPDVRSGVGPVIAVYLENQPNRDPKKKITVRFLFSDWLYKGRLVVQEDGKQREVKLKETGQPAKPMK